MSDYGKECPARTRPELLGFGLTPEHARDRISDLLGLVRGLLDADDKLSWRVIESDLFEAHRIVLRVNMTFNACPIISKQEIEEAKGTR